MLEKEEEVSEGRRVEAAVAPPSRRGLLAIEETKVVSDSCCSLPNACNNESRFISSFFKSKRKVLHKNKQSRKDKQELTTKQKQRGDE